MSSFKAALLGSALGAIVGIIGGVAHAQSSPGFQPYQPLGAVQLNAAFTAKLDYGNWGGCLTGIGLAPQIAAGCVISTGTFTGATITNSTLDASVIGGVTPAAGSFTVISGYGVEVINLNTDLTPQTAMTGTAIQVSQADTVISRIEADAFGNWAGFTGVRYDGTSASPTAVQSGEELGGASAAAYDGTTVTATGKLRCYAAQNQAVGAHGSSCAIATTANGGTTLTDQIVVGNDGGVTIGVPTGGDKGANTLNVGTVYQNGTAVSAGVSSVFTRTGAVVAATNDYTCGQVANCAATNAANTFTQKQTTVASATGAAGFNLPPGTAPTSPANGDLWTTTQTLNVQLNGSTRGIPFLNASNSFSQQNLFIGGGAGQAAINLAPQTTPSSPNNGDFWCTSTVCQVRVNGSTLTLGGGVSTASGSLTPTLAYSTPGTSSFSYATQSGNYVCVAGAVSGWARLVFTPTNGTASGRIDWTNPPYLSSTNSNNVNAGLGGAIGFAGTWATTTLVYTMIATIDAGTFSFGSNLGTTNTVLGVTNSTTATSKEMVWAFNYLTSTGTC